MSTFKTIISSVFEPIWYIGVIVPKKEAKKYISDNSRILCSVNGNEAFQGALMPVGDGNYFIILNKDRRKKWALEVNDEIQVELKKDESKYGLPVPEEFVEILYQDPIGDEIFHALTPGKQRSLIYIIGKPKSQNKRIEKGLVILEYLKKAQGKLDFKELNKAFKEANKRN